MLRNKIISGIMVATMLTGVAACDKNAGTKRIENYSTSSFTADNGDNGSSNTPNTTITSYTITYTNGIFADNKTTPTISPITTKSSDSPAPVTPPITLDNLTPIPDTDDLLFKYTYHNFAWIYESKNFYITCNGDVYMFEDNAGSVGMSNGDDIKYRYLQEYSEPTGHIDPSIMLELYKACLEIDPYVKTDMVNEMDDAGEYKFTYTDQKELTEIPLLITGDCAMKTDDPALLKAQELAVALIPKIPYSKTHPMLFLNTAFIDAPYGGTELIGTHIVFDDYDKMICYCEDNGIEINPDQETRTRWKEAKYMLMQVFDTNQPADGVLITNGEVLQFLPSLSEFEYNPFYDGKVCVSIWRFDDFEEGMYVDENGDPWKLA